MERLGIVSQPTTIDHKKRSKPVRFVQHTILLRRSKKPRQDARTAISDGDGNRVQHVEDSTPCVADQEQSVTEPISFARRALSPQRSQEFSMDVQLAMHGGDWERVQQWQRAMPEGWLVKDHSSDILSHGTLDIWQLLSKDDVQSLLQNIDQARRIFRRETKIGVVDFLRVLVDRGLSVDTEFWPGQTLLVVAARRGYLDSVRLLLEKGASVNGSAGMYGETPLMAAANEGEMDCVRLLLEHGADVNLCRRLDEDGSLLTALSSACERPLWNGYYSFLNPEDVASCLVSAGANVNLGDPTPLDWALEYHTAFGLVKFLLRAGAHISRVNDETISGLAGKALGVGSFHSWEYRQPTDKLQLLQKKAARELRQSYKE